MTDEEKIEVLATAIREDCKDAGCRGHGFCEDKAPCWHMEILMSVGLKP